MKPPDRRVIILLIILLGLAYLIASRAFAQKPPTEANSPYVSLSKCFTPARNIPYIPEYQVLGRIVDECFYKILEGESRFDPTVCNQKYGCSSGIGLGQLTAVAIADCERNLGKEIDPYNEYDNLECSLWLYEKYGTAPWGTEDTEWGSYYYWSEHCT